MSLNTGNMIVFTAQLHSVYLTLENVNHFLRNQILSNQVHIAEIRSHSIALLQQPRAAAPSARLWAVFGVVHDTHKWASWEQLLNWGWWQDSKSPKNRGKFT